MKPPGARLPAMRPTRTEWSRWPLVAGRGEGRRGLMFVERGGGGGRGGRGGDAPRARGEAGLERGGGLRGRAGGAEGGGGRWWSRGGWACAGGQGWGVDPPIGSPRAYP